MLTYLEDQILKFMEITDVIDKKTIEAFEVFYLSVEDAKKLDETDKIISKVETNLIDNENSNLHIIKNLSVDLKEILPLNKMYEGTNFKALTEYSFNNSVMLRFTNKVLVYLFGKNADTIQRDNPLYFNAL